MIETSEPVPPLMLFTRRFGCAPRPSTNFCPMRSSRCPTANGDADLAARRLTAWCRSAAAGDQSLFARRLDRDGVSIARLQAAVLRGAPPRLRAASDMARRRHLDRGGAAKLRQKRQADTDKSAKSGSKPGTGSGSAALYPFEQLFTPVVEQAEARLWSGLDARQCDNLTEARARRSPPCAAQGIIRALRRGALRALRQSA